MGRPGWEWVQSRGWEPGPGPGAEPWPPSGAGNCGQEWGRRRGCGSELRLGPRWGAEPEPKAGPGGEQGLGLGLGAGPGVELGAEWAGWHFFPTLYGGWPEPCRAPLSIPPCPPREACPTVWGPLA